MRQSNRGAILRGAVQVIQDEGITAVTFDSVAAATGLTRGGIIYHFPSREELLREIHAHLAHEWDQQIEAECGKSAADATSTERLAAYIRVCAYVTNRAELTMLLDSANGDHQEPWDQVLNRWTPQREAPTSQGVPDSHWIALLAADGLWFNEASGQSQFDQASRTRLAEEIVALL